MFKFLNSAIFTALATVFCLTSMGELQAAPRKTSSRATKSSTKKAYVKKAPYAGYGQESSVNGKPKTKIVSGHTKKTEKGYTYVNPYARSK